MLVPAHVGFWRSSFGHRDAEVNPRALPPGAATRALGWARWFRVDSVECPRIEAMPARGAAAPGGSSPLAPSSPPLRGPWGAGLRAAHLGRPLWFVALWACAACTAAGASSGGAAFNATVSAPRVAAVELAAVCWPEGASGSITHTPAGEGGLRFEASAPSLNSTARCQREVLLTAPDGRAAVGSALTLTPPAQRPSGWVVLAWARMLNEGRYGPEKLLDAAPLVRACLAQGLGLRGAPTFTVDPEARPRVQVSSESGSAGAVTDTERCVEAVLGAAAWPNSRAQRFTFSGMAGAPAAQGDVSLWFAAAGGRERPALDPAAVKEALSLRKAELFRCWEVAVARRPELEGGLSVRLRAGPGGAVDEVTVVGNLTQARSMPGDYLFQQCVAGVVRGARLPGEGESTYSWNFAL